MLGAREALRAIFPDEFPNSVLDVGCGSGSWLAAALELGAKDVVGVERVKIHAELMQVDAGSVKRADLATPLDLGRKFELVLCLETAEHLEAAHASTLVDGLARHGNRILFSAAVPGQSGMGHVNCQWPSYWQALFNARGFVCSDEVRWAIWDNPKIEPWYRQNLMLAVRDEARAGREPRVRSVVHPDLFALHSAGDQLREIEQGALPASWYAITPVTAAAAKLGRAIARLASSSARRRKVTPRA